MPEHSKEPVSGLSESIQFGSVNIAYYLTFSDRKTLGITVTPDATVWVKAPLGTSMERIEETVRRKAPWILKQQGFFLAFQPRITERRFVSGETHLYLGKQYRLMVQQGKEVSVKLKGAFIVVTTDDKRHVAALLRQWYVTRAKAKFEEIAKPLIERFHMYKVEPTALVLRDMPTRWGSCTAKGKIILNPELIKAPKACIEYVIIHELCHLVHHDHTRKFFELQTREMKDWEKWKAKLEMLLA